MYFHTNICVSVHTLHYNYVLMSMHKYIIIHMYTFTYLDINECSIGTDDCSQTCINNYGSFTCGCNSGYILDDDGTSCNPDGM